jgi:tRNA-splicing ligase RtcB (3'-phosphate/5'-hydroxy nucleic acid ligase)
MTQTLSPTHSILRPVERGPEVHAWDHQVPMEPQVWEQVRHLAAVPGVERIAIMPDAHIGKGACVGSAILTREIVIPAAVGVDIGCGMIAAPLRLRRSDLSYLPRVRAEIERRVPVGRTNRGQAGDRGAWGRVPHDVMATWLEHLEGGYRAMTRKWPDLAHPFVANHLGTLGTGNHFIEICIELDANGQWAADPRVWVMLHSGSRGIGNKIGTFFTRQAQAQLKHEGIQLPDPELGFLRVGSQLATDYMSYADWAQRYAWQNRLLMFCHVLEGLSAALGGVPATDLALSKETTHCHHNYIANEKHFGAPGLLTRKGAVNADTGVMGIIPGSMGACSYITRGLGNADSLKTSSHGAGRVMSRNLARKTITLQQHLASLEGIEVRRDADVIDESPAAYKDVEAVMRAQSDLTEPVHRLKQIVVVKG